jgi:hypothetical protein
LPPLGSPNKQLMEALKQLSAAKYGRPKASVGEEISKRLATQAPARPSLPSAGQSVFDKYGIPPSTSPATALPAQANALPPAKPKSSPSSFLDEWLEKRKNSAPGPRPQPQTVPAAVQPPPATTLPPQPVAPVHANPTPTNAGDGAFKINRDEATIADSGTLHIDDGGNISYGSKN